MTQMTNIASLDTARKKVRYMRNDSTSTMMTPIKLQNKKKLLAETLRHIISYARNVLRGTRIGSVSYDEANAKQRTVGKAHRM